MWYAMQEVVDFCKSYLVVNREAFCDPRLELIINDARLLPFYPLAKLAIQRSTHELTHTMFMADPEILLCRALIIYNLKQKFTIMRKFGIQCYIYLRTVTIDPVELAYFGGIA